MKELITIFKNIKEEFCSLWNFKERGETLEIITPYTTTSNKFVSVFLTTKNNEFVISDGGWLSNDSYECSLDFDDDAFCKVFGYYKNYYDIKTVRASELDYFFKKTDKRALIPNLVYDIANFVSAISGSSQIQFIDIKEKDEKARFNKQANTFLTTLVPKTDRPRVHFRKSINDSLKSIKFSAIVIASKNQMTLINYVTGSTIDYFIGSIGKANITFEVANKSTLTENIKNKIALINDTASGFDKNKLYAYLEQLETVTKSHNILWHQRDRLKAII